MESVRRGVAGVSPAEITMREIVLNAANWNNSEDVYDAFFEAVGAPSWHGRNFNALRDSIAGGDINQIEVPYRLVLQNFDRVGSGARTMAGDFIDLLRELAENGTPVEVVVQSSL